MNNVGALSLFGLKAGLGCFFLFACLTGAIMFAFLLPLLPNDSADSSRRSVWYGKNYFTSRPGCTTTFSVDSDWYTVETHAGCGSELYFGCCWTLCCVVHLLPLKGDYVSAQIYVIVISRAWATLGIQSGTDTRTPLLHEWTVTWKSYHVHSFVRLAWQLCTLDSCQVQQPPSLNWLCSVFLHAAHRWAAFFVK